MTQSTHDRLLIIDFGSQVTQLIARRLRELNVYCEIHPFNKVDDAFLRAFGPKAVIFSGGPASVYWDGAPMPPKGVFDLGVPILGICYGQQVMMHCLGGHVEGHARARAGLEEEVHDGPTTHQVEPLAGREGGQEAVGLTEKEFDLGSGEFLDAREVFFRPGFLFGHAG